MSNLIGVSPMLTPMCIYKISLHYQRWQHRVVMQNLSNIPATFPTTQEQVYDHSANIVTGGTGITVVDNDTDNTITISVSNEFTSADRTKLDGIADGAEVNVQADWDVTDSSSDAYIKNVPDTFPTTQEQVYDHSADIITAGTGITVVDNDTDNTITISVSNEFTDADETKLDGIAEGAEVNVQSDWSVTDSNSDAYIQNIPDTFPTTQEQVYDHSADIITAGTGITVVDNDTDNTITISVSNEFTDADETKLDGIAEGAEVNVQANWTETDANSDAYIKNVPDTFPTTQEQVYDHSADIITAGTGITVVDNRHR